MSKIEDPREKIYYEQQKVSFDSYYAFADRIIALSSGALTISVSFQKFYLNENPSHLWLLSSSWFLLLLSLLFGVWVHYGRMWTHAQAADAVVQVQIKKTPHMEILARPTRLRELAYALMIASFLIAVAFLCLFAIYNLHRI